MKSISSFVFPGIDGKKLTVSIGIGGIPDPRIDTPEKLIHAADLALYEAKRKGRGRVELEEPHINKT